MRGITPQPPDLGASVPVLGCKGPSNMPPPYLEPYLLAGVGLGTRPALPTTPRMTLATCFSFLGLSFSK